MEPAVGVLLGRMGLPTLQDWTIWRHDFCGFETRFKTASQA